MAAMFFFVWAFIVFTFIVIILNAARLTPRTTRRTVAHDGHVIPKEKDITCETKYGHNHGTASAQPRYIVHEDPAEGYVVLNGIKRRIEDCKYL